MTLMQLLITLVVVILVSELLGLVTRRLTTRDRGFVRPGGFFGWVGAFVAALLSIVIATLILWIGIAVLGMTYSVAGASGLDTIAPAVGGGFIIIGAGLHYFAYCLGGALKAWLGAAWPKLIDYPYYTAGAVLLVWIASQTSAGEQLVALRFEIVSGMILLNLKILKTSTEIFPTLYASPFNLVRTWPLRTVIYQKAPS